MSTERTWSFHVHVISDVFKDLRVFCDAESLLIWSIRHPLAQPSPETRAQSFAIVFPAKAIHHFSSDESHYILETIGRVLRIVLEWSQMPSTGCLQYFRPISYVVPRSIDVSNNIWAARSSLRFPFRIYERRYSYHGRVGTLAVYRLFNSKLTDRLHQRRDKMMLWTTDTLLDRRNYLGNSRDPDFVSRSP